MNFFSKQISTIFLSLSFFLISSEGWAGAINVILTSTCEANTGSGTCAGTCATTGDSYNFYINSVSNTDGASTTSLVIASPAAPGASETTIQCKTRCVGVCIAAKGNEYAEASTSSNTFSKSICNAFRIVTGSAGKTFAAFAIIATGIGFFSGKVSWGLMIGVAAGIATMFGAPSIVAAISGTTVDTKCTLATGMTGS